MNFYSSLLQFVRFGLFPSLSFLFYSWRVCSFNCVDQTCLLVERDVGLIMALSQE